MWTRLANVLWWLGLSIYFGGMLTLGAVVAPAVFTTARTSATTMPGIASPPLTMSNEVGGEIFGAALNRFAAVQWIALWLMLAALVGAWFSQKPVKKSSWTLLTLWLLLFAVTQYDLGYVRPQVWQLRSTVRKEAAAHIMDAPSATWPQREQFAGLHKRAEMLGQIEVYLLLAMLLVSAWRRLADGPAKQKLTRAELMREEL